ncbi:hypothetical protein ACFQZX_01000 [Mucilaginibacter litoreus]|uniref:Uncharacterized protein n=1 Tax=Mucilaginibacter litoreus TaxID=1048221 RepID=A0ABW3AMV8_9SPHI
MTIGDEMMKVLNKTYAPMSFIETTFKRYDIAFKTDDAGRPILLFIGKANETGRIKGERFARRLVLDDSGNIVKDHWDNKGKQTDTYAF